MVVGLTLNQLKIKVLVQASPIKKTFYALLQEAYLPVKYLGVPISTGYLHYAECASLLQKVMGKFDNRDSNMLSMANRAELIHTVIAPMVLYWC